MRPPPPRFLVLGGPIPDRLRVELAGVVTLVEATNLDEPVGDGVLVHERPEAVARLHDYRDSGGKLPLFVLADPPVRTVDRVRWIRDGADDVLDLNTAASALVTKLRSESWRSNSPVRFDDAASSGARIDRWLQASSRYLAMREQLVNGLGESGRTRYLDCVFLRDQLMRASDGDAAPDVFGQRRGGDRDVLGWPVRMTSPLTATGEILNIGADGACVSLPIAPGPGEHLSVLLSGERVSANCEFEVRWQRRVARGRWQVGVFSVACALDPTAP